MNRLPNLGGYTPAELQYMGMAHLFYSALTPPDQNADSLSASRTQENSNPERRTENCKPSAPINLNAEPRTENPEPSASINLNAEARTPDPDPTFPLILTPGQCVNRTSSIVNREALTPLREPRASVVKSRRRPRSKASQLPRDLQLSLNTMLANGCPYRDIIHSLDAQGYSGYNKVNLHNWKQTGYQTWLRSKTPETPT